MKEQTSAELFQILKAQLTKVDDETPEEGYLTAREWAKRSELSVVRTLHILKDGSRGGFVDVRKYRIEGHLVPHYRIRGPLLRAKVKP